MTGVLRDRVGDDMIDALPVIVFGTAGNCIDILETIEDMETPVGVRPLRCVGFLDDDPNRAGSSIMGIPVLGGIADARRYTGHAFINGIGSPRSYLNRKSIIARAGVRDEDFVSVVHRSSFVSRSATLGHGIAVLPNVAVASNVRIGNHVTILPGTVVNHDAILGPYCCIASGVCVSGAVRVGSSCYLGSNCAIMEGVTIGDGSLIGMGAVVRRDVPPGTVMVGNPARVLRMAGTERR